MTSNTSRITAAMNGMIMIARMMPADSMPMPTGGPENSAPSNGTSPNSGLQRLLHVGGQDRPEHQQAPHAVDDRRHRGQQFDGGAQRPLAASAGDSSVRNSAMPKLTGTAISSAMNEVISVP